MYQIHDLAPDSDGYAMISLETLVDMRIHFNLFRKRKRLDVLSVECTFESAIGLAIGSFSVEAAYHNFAQ